MELAKNTIEDTDNFVTTLQTIDDDETNYIGNASIPAMKWNMTFDETKIIIKMMSAVTALSYCRIQPNTAKKLRQ